jgi:hypothetical protein
LQIKQRERLFGAPGVRANEEHERTTKPQRTR